MFVIIGKIIEYLVILFFGIVIGIVSVAFVALVLNAIALGKLLADDLSEQVKKK